MCVQFKTGIPTILMTLKGQDEHEKSILLSSHYDVVPVSEEFWDSDPFAAEMRDNGDIVARGSQDMKCVGMAYLEAIRKLKCKPLKRTIHLVFTPDEEIGSANGASQLAKSDLFKSLNVGLCFDEGIPSPSNQLYIFNSERSTIGTFIRSKF
jgi:aminoacylase